MGGPEIIDIDLAFLLEKKSILYIFDILVKIRYV